MIILINILFFLCVNNDNLEASCLKPKSNTHEIVFEIGPGITAVRTSVPLESRSANSPKNKQKPFQIGVSTQNPHHVIFFPEIVPTKKPRVTFPKPIDTNPQIDSNSAVVITNNFFKENCTFNYGYSFYNDKCRIILAQSGCPEGHWLVIDNHGRPQCQRRPCPLGKVFYKSECHSIEDSIKICGQNQIFYVNYQGIAECDCQPEYIFDRSTIKCYAEYERGPCAFNKYIELDDKGNFRCIINPCVRDSLIQDPETKRCYRRNFVGRCDEDDGSSLYFEEDHGTATCISITNRNIFEVPALPACPAGSKIDHFNKCREVFRLSPYSPFTYRVPSIFTSRYSRCQPGYKKSFDGVCRKNNSLFIG